MRKRRRILLLLAVALLALVALVFFLTRREPSYKGKKLSEWAEMYALVNSFDGRNQAVDAYARIGTNSIPYLLKWIRYEPPAWKTRWYQAISPLLGKLNGEWVLRDKQNARAIGALEAFKTLGPQAAGAVADLGRVVTDPKTQVAAERATEALTYLGAKAYPTLLAALTNKHAGVRLAAVMGIRYFSHKGGSLGTNSPLAVPGLIQCLKDKDGLLAGNALWALHTLKLAPDLVVPALTDCLQDSRQYASEAASALGDFGDKARPAVPALINLLTNADFHARANATNALRKIAPEVLTNTPQPTTPPAP